MKFKFIAGQCKGSTRGSLPLNSGSNPDPAIQLIMNMIENTIRIIAVDYDGTLNKLEYGKGEDPDFDLINKLNAEQLAGAKLILWTCREGSDLEEAVNNCNKWGIHFDAINDNIEEAKLAWNNNTRKVGATIFIDDRAITSEQYLEI